MSALKYLVVCLLVGTVCSYPHIKRRYVRSPNLQMQPSYPYSNQYPNFYPTYQPGFGLPNYPMGPSQPFSYPQSNPWMMPSYLPYGSGYPLLQPSPSYPSYPSFPSYPSYPSYPYQPNLQSQPDPYANVPTEIIDVDVNDHFDLESFLPNSNSPWYPGLNWGYVNQNSSDHNQTGQHPNVNTNYLQSSGDTQRQVFSNTVTGKPFTATITRVYESDSQDPKVDVRVTNSKPGSGFLIEATGDVNEDTENKNADEEDTTDNQISNINEDKKMDEEEEEETTYASLWG